MEDSIGEPEKAVAEGAVEGMTSIFADNGRVSVPTAHRPDDGNRPTSSSPSSYYSAKCVKPAPQNHTNPKWVNNSNNAIMRKSQPLQHRGIQAPGRSG